MQPPVDSRPNFYQFIIAARRKQQTITRKTDGSNPGVMRLDQSDLLGLCIETHIPKLQRFITGRRDQQRTRGTKLQIVDLVLYSMIRTLWPNSLLGGTCRVRSHRRITLSIPAEATYLQVGCRSSDMIDYLCPLRVLIRQGSSSLFILILNYLQEYANTFSNASLKTLFSPLFQQSIMLLSQK